MRVTLAQTSPKLNRSNLSDIIAIVKQKKDDADLIVFPELALSGYLLQDKLREDAWSEDELHELGTLSSEVDIAVGAAMRDGELFRNCGLYFSGGELVAKHIKVHLPNYGMFEEARYFEGGDKFEAFELNGAKISILVCEDLWHKEVHHELLRLDPDLIVVHVASPARGFSDTGLTIETKWYEIIQTVAKECEAKLVFVNRVGFEDGLGFWGGSCVVDADGTITNKLPKFEQTVQTVEI
ncbi:nitrilase-related carbon-nitrogen hydrolase [Sulfurimonas paralvinellae]|uniref:Nitrilase n=1 Tax=Sulfurimonas paralvinellae TaxID=317658 RepID=A0A7M1B6K8_9BACT|nr:nitrilase-related carbon-nitrogen hydrolase [Sulfurimonas paralvinellae]QOP45354.1 nitrilase [Sulfurimonas paralvinellae]